MHMAVQRQVQGREQMRYAPSVRAADKGAVPGGGRHPDGRPGNCHCRLPGNLTSMITAKSMTGMPAGTPPLRAGWTVWKKSGRAAGGFQREAVSQACGLCNGLFGRQGGVHLPQWRGSQHGDLKKAAAGRFRGLSDILPAVFVYGNFLISHSPYS